LEGYISHSLCEEDLRPLFGLRILSVLNLGVNFLQHLNLSVLTFTSPFRRQECRSDILSDDNEGDRREGPYIHTIEQFRHYPPFTKAECLATGPVLDLSRNNIYDINQIFFTGAENITCLNLSSNFIASYFTENSTEFTHFPRLKYLDLSHNSVYMRSDSAFNELKELQKDRGFKSLFNEISDDIFSYFPRALTYLSMSRNTLANFEWGNSSELETLDLSKNKLSKVTRKLSKHTSTLKVLDLSHNLIFKLHHSFLKDVKSLLILSLAFNCLQHISDASFQTGSDNFRMLNLQRNPIYCTCDFLDFILWLEKSEIVLPRLATDVLCDLPESKRGHPMVSLDFKNACINNSIAQIIYVLTSSIITVMMSTTIVIHVFYWDISYIYNFWRRCLWAHSVLEWPRNSAAEGFFWQSLRNAVRFESQGVQSKLFTNYFRGR
uniref:Toll-like receptor 8b n=1 Tax=Sinocyclocheilus rhinocerous TaxID=307959 RepID=A0A673MGA1_9TELE